MNRLEQNPGATPRGEGTFSGFDGTRLFFRWARPEQPRGTVVVVHGLAEHSGRYGALADAVVAGGFGYYGYDLRGHGQSEGRRGDVRRFSDYVADLELFLGEAGRREGNLPLFLLGHSLGGIVAVLCALDQPSGLAGLIASSSVFRLRAPPSRVALIGARLLSWIAPRLRVANGLRPEQLSTDPGVVAANRADPLVQRDVTVRWVVEFFHNYSRAIEGAGNLSLPLLVLQGGDDQIAAADGARLFFESAGSTDKTLRIYPGLWHELFNEPPEDRRPVVGDLLDWLRAHDAGGGTALERIVGQNH